MKLAYSAKNNLVVWTEIEDPLDRRFKSVPGAAVIALPGEKWCVAAPCTLESQIVAANLKLPAYSPILVKGNYDWPSAPYIRAPFAHQYEMAAMLTLHHRMHNLAEIGTGKTLGCLWAADFLKRQKVVRTVVVACPLSTVNSVWRDHIGEHFSGLRRSAVCAGTKHQRLRALASDADFLIINHDGFELPYVQKALAERDDIDLVILDEGDRYKNRTTDRYKALYAYVNGTDKAPKNMALWNNTGTPTPKLPTDAWAQQNLIKKPWMSYRQFEDRTTYKVGTFKRVATSTAKDEVVQLLQPAIRFLRKDCIDLPPTQVISQQCDITSEQVHALRQLKQKLRLEIGGKSITALNEGVLRSKILQVMAGAVYDHDHAIHVLDSKPRIARCTDICDSSEGKTLVFTHLTSIAKMLHQHLGGALVIGETSLNQRTEIFSTFQKAGRDELSVIVADARTMAHGLTLTAADKVVWYTPADGPGTYVQANGRITRPGQERETLIYQLWVAQLERQVYARHMGAESLQGLVMSWLDEEDF